MVDLTDGMEFLATAESEFLQENNYCIMETERSQLWRGNYFRE